MIIDQTLLHNALYAGQGEDLDDTEGDVGSEREKVMVSIQAHILRCQSDSAPSSLPSFFYPLLPFLSSSPSFPPSHPPSFPPPLLLVLSHSEYYKEDISEGHSSFHFFGIMVVLLIAAVTAYLCIHNKKKVNGE